MGRMFLWFCDCWPCARKKLVARKASGPKIPRYLVSRVRILLVCLEAPWSQQTFRGSCTGHVDVEFDNSNCVVSADMFLPQRPQQPAHKEKIMMPSLNMLYFIFSNIICNALQSAIRLFFAIHQVLWLVVLLLYCCCTQYNVILFILLLYSI